MTTRHLRVFSTPIVRRLAATIVVIIVAATGRCACAVTSGQTDDFENLALSGWSGNLPTMSVETSGGPQGTDDAFLRVMSTGFIQAGSRLATFNQAQWAGDYVAAQIAAIELDARNFGANPLALRIAFGNGAGDATWFASTSAHALPGAGAWTRLRFPLADVTRIGGAATLESTLAQVASLRIVSSENLPTLGGGGVRGDVVQGDLGLDNITAAPAVHVVDADFDDDNDVDGHDFLTWQRGFGSNAPHAQGDANGDGMVALADFQAWESAFGSGAVRPSVVSIPEPSSVTISAVVGIVGAWRSRGKRRSDVSHNAR